MKKIINLGIQDYVADLYRDGEISIREAAEILEEKVGSNMGHEEEIKALNLARKLAEKS